MFEFNTVFIFQERQSCVELFVCLFAVENEFLRGPNRKKAKEVVKILTRICYLDISEPRCLSSQSPPWNFRYERWFISEEGWLKPSTMLLS